MSRTTFRGLALGVMVLLGTTACQDLDIINENDPDRIRANSDPEALQALGAGAYFTYWATVNATNVTALFPNMATEMTSTTNVGGFFGESQVPRPPHANPVTAPALSTTGAREHWAALLRTTALADDVLRLTDAEALGPAAIKIIIDGVDQTPRSRAFAHFVQGMAWGNMANIYDKAIVVKSTDPIPTDPTTAIVTADVALAAALESLDKAIAIATANNVTFPSRADAGDGLWFGSPTTVTTQRFVQAANTIAARLLVNHARTPAERAATDWNRVLAYTNAGLQTLNLEVELHSGQSSNMLSILMNETISQGACTTCSRWDMLLIGHGDISGAYQTWLAASPDQKARFNITSPDRRLQGPGGPTTLGSYTRWLATLGAFVTGRPSYYHSAYQWRRHAHDANIIGGTTTATVGLRNQNSGIQEITTADENKLLAAEAHLRLGNLTQARDLINVTRTRPQRIPPATTTIPNLPPVTVQGAPHSAPGANDCVPRTDSGQCGDLLVALWYERMIELVGMENTRGWADNRGFGLMENQSWLQLPIPGNELDQLQIPLYTFGGPGGESSAVYAPVGGGWSGNP